MSGVVQDNFSSPGGGGQNNSPVLNNPYLAAADPNISPTTLTRTVSNAVSGDTSRINVAPDLGIWTVVNGGSLVYTYDSPKDFSSLTNITLQVLTLTTFPAGNSVIYRMAISDGVVSPNIQKPLSSLAVPATLTWTISEFTTAAPTLDINNIVSLFISVGSFPLFTSRVTQLSSTAVCLAKDSEILMADGSIELIQNIKRGDEVAGNLDITTTHKVARLFNTKFPETYKLDLVKFEKDSIRNNEPNKTTYLTSYHPVLYKGQRKPAKCFEKFPGVTVYKDNVYPGGILNKDDDSDLYSIYNLQFDEEGFFVANGLQIQSVSPHSNLVPLPKNKFFNETNINKNLTWESYHTDTPWSIEIIDL